MVSKGAELALLLLGGFRIMVDTATAELLKRGYAELRPAQEFALRAIAAGATNASELARRLSVSKQAAAKTIAVLEANGLVERRNDPVDWRSKLLMVTPMGFESMQQGEAILDALRSQWAEKIGPAELDRLEASLAALVGDSRVHPEAAGRIAQDTD